MSIQQAASSNCHTLLSELIDRGLAPPDSTVTAVERSEQHGFQVVTHISKYEKPQLHLSAQGYEILGIAPPAPPASSPLVAPSESQGLPVLGAIATRPPSPQVHLPPRQRKILEVLKGQPPRKAEWIAHKVKRDPHGGFRQDLAELKKLGLIEKGRDGWGYQIRECPH